MASRIKTEKTLLATDAMFTNEWLISTKAKSTKKTQDTKKTMVGEKTNKIKKGLLQ